MAQQLFFEGIPTSDQWWEETEEDAWEFEEELPQWQVNLEERWGLNPGMLEIFLQDTAERMYSGAVTRQ